MNIGVLGGTFDPIHNGHITIAEESRKQLDLDEVVLVPAGQPLLKENSTVLAAAHRVQMIQLVITTRPFLKLSVVEIEQEGPAYTVDTLGKLREQRARDDQLFLILGWDNLARFAQWREPSRIIELCRLVAVPRRGGMLADLQVLESAVPGLTQRLVILDIPVIDISATEIRNRVARGLPVDHLVPEPVDQYIKQHKLYLNDGDITRLQ